jgi:putative DNA primase/helicase
MIAFPYDAKMGASFLCNFCMDATEGTCEGRIFEETPEQKPPTKRFWFTEPGEEISLVRERLQRREHVYIGVAARVQGGGDKKSLLYTDFVWAEMDFKDFANGEQEARERLSAYGKQPAMVVHSGGGLHVYFRIERFDLTTEANRTRLERVLKQFCVDLGADNAATDCSRILRLPGTWNFKAKYGEPRPVVLERLDGQAPTYPLDAFPMLAEAKKRTTPSEPRTYSTTGIAPDDAEVLRVALNSAKGGKIARLMAGDTGDYKGDHSSADCGLCHYLAYFAGPGGHAQVERLWRSSNLWREKGDARHNADGRSYAQMTVDAAYEGRTAFHNWNGKAKQARTRRAATAPAAPAEPPSKAESETNGERTDAGQAEGEEAPDEATTDDEGDVPDQIAIARTFMAGLWEQIGDDPGKAFTSEAIGHLYTLYTVPEEWARVKPLLRKHKVAMTDIERTIKQYLREEHEKRRAAQAVNVPEAPEPTEPRQVDDLLRDPPVRNLLVPNGYRLSEKGITNDDEELVSHAPVLITRRLHDIDEHTESLCLTWKRSNGWQHLIVTRSVALNSQQIVSLADLGFPVSSDNARALVGWLHDFEAINFPLLPVQDVASHLGWQGAKNEQGFLWGREYITPEGERLDTNQAEHAPLKFHVSDPGTEQMAEAFHARGTFERWQSAVSGLDQYPVVQLALYAAFIPPLLPILDAANVIVDWTNRTSTGKTTALRVAASVWGCSDDRMPDSLINSWDATRVWIERASCMLNGLPLLLDDTKRAKRPEQVAQTLYDVANGRGKGRGSLKGTQRITRWRTVLLSTGEAPATSFTEDGGTRTRCIECVGAPFGKDDGCTAQTVRALNRALIDNYGHAGPMFVQWLLQHRADWPSYAAAYRGYIQEFDSQSGATSRMAEHLALFRLVAILIHDAGIIDWQYEGVPPELAKAIMAEAEEASGELRALRHVISWAYSHEYNFLGREAIDSNGNKRSPLTIAGKWDFDEEADLCFLPGVLKNVLQEGKFAPDAILHGWRECGWIETDKDGNRFTKKMSINNEKTAHVVIRREALFDAE